jgi:hypothetical protein
MEETEVMGLMPLAATADLEVQRPTEAKAEPAERAAMRIVAAAGVVVTVEAVSVAWMEAGVGSEAAPLADVEETAGRAATIVPIKAEPVVTAVLAALPSPAKVAMAATVETVHSETARAGMVDAGGMRRAAPGEQVAMVEKVTQLVLRALGVRSDRSPRVPAETAAQVHPMVLPVIRERP